MKKSTLKASYKTGLRSSLRIALSAALVVITVSQVEAQEPMPAVGASGESAGGAAAPSEAGQAPAEPQVSETHVVGSGDTLWDLCTKYLNSPWYWPKIWSYNPQITNPHWIFPGNELRFYPSDESLPTAVEVSRDLNAPGDSDEFLIPGSMDVEDLVKAVAPITMAKIPGNSYLSERRAFISTAEQALAGQITNSVSEAQLLADYDRVYLRLKTAARKGQNFAIYRNSKEIIHPFTGKSFGFSVEILGSVTIVETSPQVATGVIDRAFRPIERGDFVGPWPETAGQRVAPRANEFDLKAYIMEVPENGELEIGEHHVVYIDKGRADGVKLGNTFAAFARGDRYTRDLAGLPNEQVGQLLIIDVQEQSATAMVVRSLVELSAGQKIEMRKSI
jgi:hypothetical protein